jgi:hypothetical protein
LIAFLKPDEIQMPDLMPGSGAAKYLDWAWNFCAGRSFFTTKEGYIGLAPKAAKPNDRVCVIFGCPSPILLRWSKNLRYQVIGECYVPGLTNGEAILGPLPNQYRPVLVYDEDLKNHYAAYLNTDTRETQNDDPRLKSLLGKGIDVYKEKTNHNKAAQRLSPEAMRASGLQIETFELE